MCYIDKTNYIDCTNSNHHNGARQIDPREFEADYPQYQYQTISPGYVPCNPVLEARYSAQQCHDLFGPIEIRLMQPTPCPHCNFIGSEHGHQVTYREGRVVLVTYYQNPHSQNTHQVHQPFVPYCLLCRSATGDRIGGKIGGGPLVRDATFGYAPSGPPGREAYDSYGWGPKFR